MPSLIIASDVRLFRDGLAHALRRVADFAVEATTSVDDAAATARVCRPDVVILDFAGEGRRAAVREIASLDRVAVLVLALDEAGEAILECVEAGASGYLTRDGSLDDLVAAIRSVVRGEMLCSPRVAAAMVRRLATLAADRARVDYSPLTGRELEVAALIDCGQSNKEIARSLGIGVATVKNHIHNILEKLHVRRRGDAAACLRRSEARAADNVARPRISGDLTPRPAR